MKAITWSSVVACLISGICAAQQEGEGAPIENPESAIVETVLDPLVEQTNAALRARRGEVSADAAGPTGGPRTGDLFILMKWFLSLFVVLALILALYGLRKRFGSKTPFFAGADLGSILGRIHLSNKAALYFVATGGRVLVVGVSGDNISLVSEFDEATFDGDDAGAEETTGDAENFLSQLQGSTRASGQDPTPPDDGFASLRGDVQRMRRMLEDETKRYDE